MKKIFYSVMLMAGCLFMASCNSDDDYVDKVSSVQVTEASTFISAKGGSETIKVNVSDITATAADAWLTTSVSGNVITVSAGENPSRETRHTTVTIKATNGDQQIVNVSQMGTIFIMNERTVSLSDDPETASVAITHDAANVVVNSLSSWISASWNDATSSVELTTQANKTGLGRTGYVEIVCGNYADTLSVEQYDFNNDVLGEYDFYYSKSATQAQWAALAATLTSKTLTLSIGQISFTIPVRFPNGTNRPFVVEVANQPFVGTYGNYFCYLAFDCSSYNLLSRYPQYFFPYLGASVATMTLDFEEYEGVTYFNGVFGGMLDLDGDPLDEITTWYILAMNAQEYSQANLAGSLLTMHYPQVEKVVASDETAAARRAASRRAERIQAEELKYILAATK